LPDLRRGGRPGHDNLTPGEAHEIRAFGDLVEDLAAGTRCLIGDMGYDAAWVRQELLLLRGVLPVIPPNPVRKEPFQLDRELCRLRNRVERLVNSTSKYGVQRFAAGLAGTSRGESATLGWVVATVRVATVPCRGKVRRPLER
jgi:hypothetical protein